jgi:hypothetical protein
VLSLLLLGAHFLRDGAFLVLAVIVGLLMLLTVRRPWAGRIVQAALVLGTLEWIRTLVDLAGARIEAGRPFGRLTVILGAVAAVTLLSALAFQFGQLGRMYGLRSRSPDR